MRMRSPCEFCWTGRIHLWGLWCIHPASATNYTPLAPSDRFWHQHHHHRYVLSMCYQDPTCLWTLWWIPPTNIWTGWYCHIFYSRCTPKWHVYQRLRSPALFYFLFHWCSALCCPLDPRLTACSSQHYRWRYLVKYLVDLILGERYMDSPNPSAIMCWPLGALHHWLYIQMIVPLWQLCWAEALEEQHSGMITIGFSGKLLKYN